VKKTIVAVFALVSLIVVPGGYGLTETPQVLYAKHRYFESIDMLEKSLENRGVSERDKAVVSYIIGLNFLKLGALYDELFRQAAFFEKEYYTLLLEEVPSLAHDSRLLWFKGQCHFILDEYDEAVRSLELAVSNDQMGKYTSRAKLWKGAALLCREGKRDDLNAWKSLMVGTSSQLAVEAAFLCYLKRDALIPSSEPTNNGTAAGNALSTWFYAMNGRANDVQGILKITDFDDPADSIVLEDGGIVNLYDLTVLKAYATLAHALALDHFEKCKSSGDALQDVNLDRFIGECLIQLARYSDAVILLGHNEDNLESSVYLALGYWKKGDESKALKLWKTIGEKSKDPRILSDCAYRLACLDIQLQDAENMARNALEIMLQNQRRRELLQPFHATLGYVLFRQGNIKESIAAFRNGFVSSQKHTVEVNDPEIALRFVHTLYLPDVLSYDLINETMLVIGESYRGAGQLRNAMSGIYLIRFKNQEGGKVRDGH